MKNNKAPLIDVGLSMVKHSSKKEKKDKQRSLIYPDDFGRTGSIQVLHIDLFYSDGTKGVINVTSPHIGWGEDIESQWIHMKAYIKSQYQRLGIVGYHAHCHYVDAEGTIKKSHSWFPFDLIKNKEMYPQTNNSTEA